MVHLLDLPNEILSFLPLYINDIETFINAAATCRRLRDNFNITTTRTILKLAAASAPTFFSPHPHFLVMATARQASDWTLGNQALTKPYDLRAGLTLHDIRCLYLSRFDTINPLADKIDKMAGGQWYDSSEHFWEGGVSEPWTLHTESNRAAFQIIIYGELFGRSMENFLDCAMNSTGEREQQQLLCSRCFDLDTRLDYIKYCIPDWIHCRGYGPWAVLKPRSASEGLEDDACIVCVILDDFFLV